MDYQDSLYDLVWGMLDTGCAYWAYAVDHGCDTPNAHANTWDQCAGCWTVVGLHEDSPSQGYTGTYRIDAEAIRRGVEAVAAEALDRYPYDGVPIARAWVASLAAGADTEYGENTHDEGDDDWADWVVQHGLFGELVYG